MKMRVFPLAAILTVTACLLLVWLSLGVGIIGRDGEEKNRLYLAVPLVILAGALVARGRPAGMSRALLAAAILQGLIGATAIALGWGRPWSGPMELLLLNGFFVGLFTAAALLFRSTARS